MDDLDKKIGGGIFLILFFVSIQPVFLDPYYHKEKVTFWLWLQREIDELLHGERE